MLYSKNIIFKNISCFRNNKKGNISSEGGGTCFVLRNNENISFDMVEISDSYSNYTTVGVKVIESDVNCF